MSNNATLKKTEMKAMPMQITRSRTSKFCTRDHPDTSEVEAGGEGETVMLLVSAGEALAHAKPTRTLKDRLNKEALLGQTHKGLVQRSPPPPPQHRPTSSNSNLLM